MPPLSLLAPFYPGNLGFMRIGLCCSPERADEALEVGFDYVELPAGRLFWEAAERVSSCCEATNLFVAGSLKLVGPERGDVEAYGRKVIPAAAAAGIRVMVVGSGAARNAPEGYDVARAHDEFLDAVSLWTEIGRPLGVAIAPESLQRSETNVGNSMGELARRLHERGCAFTADIFHLIQDWRFQGGQGAPTDVFWAQEIPFAPAHVHFADSDRAWNLSGDGAVKGFVRRLKALGYEGRVSLECSTQDLSLVLSEARKALA